MKSKFAPKTATHISNSEIDKPGIPYMTKEEYNDGRMPRLKTYDVYVGNCPDIIKRVIAINSDQARSIISKAYRIPKRYLRAKKSEFKVKSYY